MTENDELQPLGVCIHGKPLHYRFPCEECLELDAIDLGMDEEDIKVVEKHLTRDKT